MTRTLRLVSMLMLCGLNLFLVFELRESHRNFNKLVATLDQTHRNFDQLAQRCGVDPVVYK